MTGIPLTRKAVSEARAAQIRRSIRAAIVLPQATHPSRLAQPDDAAAFYEFLSAPGIHLPIYSLPKPLTRETVRDFIEDHVAQREAGSGLLFLRVNAVGEIVGYSDFQIWPKWAAGELGGALRADLQGQREGLNGAKASFQWMFDNLGLELICETASLDNIRTAKLLDHLGFQQKGEVESLQSDGTTRLSRVWEVDRHSWTALHQTY